ncbi:MAG: hypothetical protein M1433_00230 [Candidatus Parvarchaeota archaeon]|nr:hypothetical protein [Candidatus Parvarchaeota archaeon]
MAEDILTVPRRVLEDAYDLYNDLNGINSSLSKIGSILGAKNIEMPSILERNAREKTVTISAPNAPSEKAKTDGAVRQDTHIRAASLKRAFGFTSRVLESSAKQEPYKPQDYKKKSSPAAVGTILTAPTVTHATAAPTMVAKPRTEIIPLRSTDTVKIDNSTQFSPSIMKRPEFTKEEKRPVTSAPLQSVPAPPQIQVDKTINKTEPVLKAKAQPSSQEDTDKIVRRMEGYSFTQPENLENKESANSEKETVMASNNPVSNLLNLVKTKHSITIGEAAATMNVNRTLVETWAKLLNSNALLKIKYQLVGDTILEA